MVESNGASARASEAPLLRVTDLRTYLYTKSQVIKAVDGVSLEVDRGQCLGLVGESGSGKSMTCLSIMRLLPQPVARIVGGSINLEGHELAGKSQDEMRQYRGRRMAMILQDPMTSLNPAFTIADQVLESVRVKFKGTADAAWSRMIAALQSVKIPASEQRATDYPHQLSGGMRQRVVGAMAVASDASLLIADEPTTALDVTIQSEYLALLGDLQREKNLGIIFVTHDLGIVAHMCDRVAVMYAGRIVEQADVMTLFDAPAHPYTRALLTSVPSVEVQAERLPSIDGQPPDLGELPEGCSFAPRCPSAFDRCWQESPPEFTVAPGQTARCWLAEK